MLLVVCAVGRKVCFLGMARRNDAPPNIPDDVGFIR